MSMMTRRTHLASMAGLAITGLSRGATAADADTAAPFGLTWGVSTEDVTKAGVKLTPFSIKSNFGASFMASGLSKVLSDMSTADLFFGFSNKLFRIAAVGQTINADPGGGQIVSRYRDLASSLSERYGPGKETDLRDTSIWKAPNDYLMSLNQGRAYRYTSFKNAVVEVELSVRAESDSAAHYLILFENRAGMRQFELDKKAHEKDAL